MPAALAQDASVCQSSCAAPAELYVYRNPGQEIDQAISLNGTAYSDLPAAFKYRKEYIKGCSCKADEYNPTAIEAANQKAEATPAPGKPGKKERCRANGPGRSSCRTAAWPTRCDRRLPDQPNCRRARKPRAEAPAPPTDAAPAPQRRSNRGAAANERRQTHASLRSLQ